MWIRTRPASVGTDLGLKRRLFSSGERNSDVAGTIAPSIGSHLRACDEQMLSIQSGSLSAGVGSRAAHDPATARVVYE